MTESEALLVLNAVPNLDAVRIRKLIKFFGSALDILGASDNALAVSRVLLPEQVQNIINFSKDKFLKHE